MRHEEAIRYRQAAIFVDLDRELLRTAATATVGGLSHVRRLLTGWQRSIGGKFKNRGYRHRFSTWTSRRTVTLDDVP
jgi:hypothetical protein